MPIWLTPGHSRHPCSKDSLRCCNPSYILVKHNDCGRIELGILDGVSATNLPACSQLREAGGSQICTWKSVGSG